MTLQVPPLSPDTSGSPTSSGPLASGALTSFSLWQTITRRSLEDALLRAEAQTEAALDLLERAQAGGHDPAFWQDALEHAEAEEASARRALSTWKTRDREADRRTFAFARALSEGTALRLKAREKEEEKQFRSHVGA